MRTQEESMHKILIDTAKRYEKSVKLFKDDKLLGEKFGDIDVTVEIQSLLKENNLKLSEIDEISANHGPGSFTGLKIGVTVANILNWALGKKKISELSYPNYGSEPNIHKTKWFDEQKPSK